MTKLTDTQLAILSSAAQRQDRGVLLPERLMSTPIGCSPLLPK